MNKVIIIGNLGADPELTESDKGNFGRMRVGVTSKWKDAQGQAKEHTEWFSVKTFGAVAANCAKYLRKGSKICVEGELRTDKFEKKDGSQGYMTYLTRSKVEFLDTKSTNGGSSSPAKAKAEPEEDIPF